MNRENTTGSSQGDFAPEPRVYELGYLVMPSVDEGDLATRRDALVALITKLKGIVIDEGQPVLIDLAYEMDKMVNNKRQTYTQAYFGWIKFDVSPRDIEALTTEVEAVDELIRFILVKTVRENTLTSEQPFRLAKTQADTSDEEDLGVDEGEVYEEEETEAKSDDLTKIEGIGPVIASTLTEGGIATFADLASAEQEQIQELITGVRGSHDSTTWPQQADLASSGKWDELNDLQDSLKGGVKEE
jgi:predicted flap endonuclease-1-like 5' DNA nuclease